MNKSNYILAILIVAFYLRPAFPQKSEFEPLTTLSGKIPGENILPSKSIGAANQVFAPLTAPANDMCESAEPIVGPYPVSNAGSTLEATVDCPLLLNWPGIWYAIELPYENNDIAITICGTSENIIDLGTVLMDDCNCDDYTNVSEFAFIDEGQCFTAYSGFQILFRAIPQSINEEGIAYWPLFVVNEFGQGMDFSYEIDVAEAQPPPTGDSCDDPILIAGLPFTDSLNSCDFNNNYNFGGRDVVYYLTLDSCTIIEISLCNTDPIFDTYLLVYSDTNCGGTPMATNDDGCMPPGQYGTSTIADTLQAGSYYIVVDAYGGECGPFELVITGQVCPGLGACCLETVCIGSRYESGCDSAGGAWFAGEDCELGYICPGACGNYLPGDVNMYNGNWPPQVIGSDVTYLVNFFRGLSSSHACLLEGFWYSADANGDCNIIGSDVTRMVNYFRGITTLEYCPDFAPCWFSPADLPSEPPTEGWPNCALLRR